MQWMDDDERKGGRGGQELFVFAHGQEPATQDASGTTISKRKEMSENKPSEGETRLHGRTSTTARQRERGKQNDAKGTYEGEYRYERA